MKKIQPCHQHGNKNFGLGFPRVYTEDIQKIVRKKSFAELGRFEVCENNIAAYGIFMIFTAAVAMAPRCFEHTATLNYHRLASNLMFR